MANTLAVPSDRLEAIRGFVTAEGIPVHILQVEQAPDVAAGVVRVVPATAGAQSSAAVLQAGGWIACATAFEAARRLGITPAQLGKLLDHLDIRIRACQLGCFE